MPSHLRKSAAERAAAEKATQQKTKKMFFFAIPALIVVGALLVYSSIPQINTIVCSVQRAVGNDGSADWLPAYADADNSPAPFRSAEYNKTMFWGTYRPQVYMGVKSRSEKPLMFGIAWVDTTSGFSRHEAGEGSDMEFRWVVHDGRHFGRQRIVDHQFMMTIDIFFLKNPSGDGWTVRVTGTKDSGRPVKMIVYFVSDDVDAKTTLFAAPGSFASTTNVTKNSPAAEAAVQAGGRNDVFVRGGAHLHDGSVGEFFAKVTDSCGHPSNWEVVGWGRKGKPRDFQQVWQVPLMHRTGGVLLDEAELQSEIHNNPTSKIGKKATKLRTIVLRKEIGNQINFDISVGTRQSATSEDFNVMPSCAAQTISAKRQEQFHERFASLFNLNSASHTLPTSVVKLTSLVAMGEMALSNMIGGIGFWSGKYKTIDFDLDARADITGRQIDPHVAARHASETDFSISLFSGVPSRAKFPRGFLWDEGFHQLLMAKWDPEISKDIISHWMLNAKDAKTGWIPREQILGGEARTRVPHEFIPQHPTHANPPSMIIQVQNFALAAAASGSHHDDFLETIVPHLQQWRQWFHNTQCGGPTNCSLIRRGELAPTTEDKDDQFAYRWRSRNKFHLLASGLDDYARPVGKDHTKELHLDLYCWVSLMTSTMSSIQKTMNMKDVVGFDEAEWEEELIAHHWDAKRNRFSDVTGRAKKDKKFSEFFGYVNLFPILTMTINDKEKALAVIREARDELMTGFGLASMSADTRKLLKETKFPHEHYWTGPIWVNLNFLFLRALKLKYNELLGEESEQVYQQLRRDLIFNIGNQYQRTNKLWENYNPEVGEGQGTAPFTGWTSLITLIMAEQY